MKAFISHTKKDKEAVLFSRQLVKFLTINGVEVIFDEFSFRHGHSITKEIADSIYSSDKFILIASKKSFESNYVNFELDFARDRQVELHPEAFIHLVNLEGDESSITIPRELKGSLYYEKAAKSIDKLNFEILFGLHGFKIGQLLMGDIRNNLNPDWVALSRHDIAVINNLNGDASFEHHMAMMNITEAPNSFTHTMNMWSIDGDIKKRPIQMFVKNNKIKSEEILKEDYRGRPTLRYKVEFEEPILPEEVLSYHYKLAVPEVFDMNRGQYELECEHKGYGRYRLDIYFPKTVTEIKSKITFYKDGIENEVFSPKSIGYNIQSFELFNVTIGSKYVLEFETSSSRVGKGESHP